MEYLHKEFELQPNDLVEVDLTYPANVMLLDPTNFLAYQDGRPFDYYGGYITQTPYRIRIPQAGKWHVVVDLGGGPGKVSAVVRISSPSAVA